MEVSRSLLYKEHKQGRRSKDVVIDFDWKKQEAQYSNFGKKRDPIAILPGSFDPLSVFYAFRFYDLHEQKVLRTPVTDGKKCVMGQAEVIKREKIRLPIGTYETFLVEPELKDIGGVYEKSKDATLKIWVTADRRRIPVRIESKVVVGSFVAELVSVEGACQD
jgi:hypothetical protein